MKAEVLKERASLSRNKGRLLKVALATLLALITAAIDEIDDPTL